MNAKHTEDYTLLLKFQNEVWLTVCNGFTYMYTYTQSHHYTNTRNSMCSACACVLPMFVCFYCFFFSLFLHFLFCHMSAIWHTRTSSAYTYNSRKKSWCVRAAFVRFILTPANTTNKNKNNNIRILSSSFILSHTRTNRTSTTSPWKFNIDEFSVSTHSTRFRLFGFGECVYTQNSERYQYENVLLNSFHSSSYEIKYNVAKQLYRHISSFQMKSCLFWLHRNFNTLHAFFHCKRCSVCYF